MLFTLENDEIVRQLFTPLFPWEDNMLISDEIPTMGKADILKTIRILGR